MNKTANSTQVKDGWIIRRNEMVQQNISEKLLEELCFSHSVPIEKIEAHNKSKRPDYEITMSSNLVIAEVKQVDPNPEDIEYAIEFEKKRIVSRNLDPDKIAKRIRNDIKESMRQIRSYFEENLPAPSMIVIYDNANSHKLYTDNNTIRSAMYGWEQVVISTEEAVESLEVIDQGFGRRNNSTIRPDKNTELSALVTLHEGFDHVTKKRFLSLVFYHNKFASHPILPSWWQNEKVFHYQLEDKTKGEFQNWIPYEVL